MIRRAHQVTRQRARRIPLVYRQFSFAPSSHSNSLGSSAAVSNAAPSSSRSRYHRVLDLTVGILSGVTLYECAQYLLSFPPPLPMLKEIISADPLVRAQIGDRVFISPLWSGNVSHDAAAVTLPLYGANGRGTVYANAIRSDDDGAWQILALQCAVGRSAQRHSLLVSSAAPPPQ